MDTVFIEGIEVYAYGGVSKAEREVGQRYKLDLWIDLDLSTAAATDCVNDTVSYADAYKMALEVMASGKFALIESPAERIAKAILDRTRARAVTVELRKVAPPIPGVVSSAGVRIRREKASPD